MAATDRRRGRQPPVKSGPRIVERTPGTPLPRDLDAMPPFDEADRTALIALSKGTAAPHMQQRALGWIMFASGHTDRLYRPGQSSEYVLGRHAVAEAILAVLSSPQPTGRSDTNEEQG